MIFVWGELDQVDGIIISRHTLNHVCNPDWLHGPLHSVSAYAVETRGCSASVSYIHGTGPRTKSHLQHWLATIICSSTLVTHKVLKLTLFNFVSSQGRHLVLIQAKSI